jgi:hypothetical protein
LWKRAFFCSSVSLSGGAEPSLKNNFWISPILAHSSIILSAARWESRVERLTVPVPVEDLCYALDIKEMADLETGGL